MSACLINVTEKISSLCEECDIRLGEYLQHLENELDIHKRGVGYGKFIMKVRTLAIAVAALLTATFIVIFAKRSIQVVLPDRSSDHPAQVKCRSSVDRIYVVDEKGMVCKWLEVDYNTGCCPTELDVETSPFSCFQCKDSCCSIYAFCVSCCLDPANPIERNTSDPNSYVDKFDHCRAACRTNSRSVINENQWKSELKYCFPKKDIHSDTIIEDSGTELITFPEFSVTSMEHTFESTTSNQIIDTSDQLTSREEKVGYGFLEATLTEISKSQKTQEGLLVQLEEKVKHLIEENQQLLEENKYLSSKLEQTQKGKGKETGNEGSGRWNAISMLGMFLVCLCGYGLFVW